ncbi:HNH endonuclease [Brevibacillus laterosporus]|nr:HNH endonuclease [Brevibacillus laterosporus]
MEKSKNRIFKKAHPLCKHCFDKSLLTGATVVDHIVPHREIRRCFGIGTTGSHNMSNVIIGRMLEKIEALGDDLSVRRNKVLDEVPH